MNVNFENKTIEMTAKEAKAAGKVGSEAFKELMSLRASLSGFEVAIVAAPKRKSTYSGLTYEYMVAYIEKHDDENKTIMTEFKTLRGIVSDTDKDNLGEVSEKLESVSYGEIRKWFLETFEEIKKFHDDHDKKVKEILNKKKVA